MQKIQNSKQGTGCAEELLCTDFLCDHWSSSVTHISAAFSILFRSLQAKIPGPAAGMTDVPWEGSVQHSGHSL